MLIQAKKIIVQTILDGIGKEGSIKNFFYDSCAVQTSEYVEHTQYSVPEPSNLDHIIKRLLRYVRENEYKDFYHLLNNVVINSVIRCETETQVMHAAAGYPNHRIISTYAICKVRPTIRAIYFEKPAAFLLLVNELIKQDQDRYYDAFINCMSKAGLDVDSLFACTAEMKFDAYEAINSLKEYGDTLAEKEDKSALNKGSAILQIDFDKLRKTVAELDARHIDYHSQFSNLKLKCEVLNELQDCSLFEGLGVHRNRCKRIITNIITILFMGAIPNIINLIATGGRDFLFFNRTTSEKRLMGVVDAIGVENQLLPNPFR